MARITVEDCLMQINNRFALIHMTAKRVRQLRKGIEPSIISKNRDIVIALREIAAGNVVKAEGIEQQDIIENETVLITEELLEENETDHSDHEKKEEATVPEDQGNVI